MAIVPQAAPPLPPGDGAASEQDWPAPRVGWYAVSVLAITLMFAELDRNIFGQLVELVKKDLQISDYRMSWLLGPAAVVFSIFGVFFARLVDVFPRNVVLSIGVLVWSGMTSVSGLAQNYWQLFFARVGIGAGGTVNGPGTYSMLADYFPPRKLPRAIAGLSAGFILGNGLAFIIGGALIAAFADWQPTEVAGLTIRNWQMVLILVGLPGLLIAILVRTLPEPPRRGKMAEAKAASYGEMFRAMWQRRGIYIPMFMGLTFSALETYGIRAWQSPWIARTYGWDLATISYALGIVFLISMPIGTILGTWLTEHFGKTHKDAPLRVTLIGYVLVLPCATTAPLMPTAELALFVAGLSAMFGFIGAVPQNAAIQTITPNEMRGQVTALYLMIFVVGGALGSVVVASITNFVIGDESRLWLAIIIAAASLQPIAIVAMSFGLRHYRKEIERLEAKGLY
jgi:MFS family permease